MIAVEGVGARAGAFALRDVSFTLPRGAWGIVLGAAGSGKTTLLETIAGVRAAIAGRVLLRGEDVTRVPAERRGVGIVYQHAYLFPHLSVEQNVRYGATDPAHALSLARRLGAGPLLARGVRDLSGGERQLVALARALATRPDILLLDEPFTGLDAEASRAVRALLPELRDRGCAVVMATHAWGEARDLADDAVVLVAGRLALREEAAALDSDRVAAAYHTA